MACILFLHIYPHGKLREIPQWISVESGKVEKSMVSTALWKDNPHQNIR